MSDKTYTGNGPESQPFKIATMRLLRDQGQATRAFADLRVGPFLLHGFAVIMGKKGDLFVAPPSRLKDNKNYPYVSIDSEWREPIF